MFMMLTDGFEQRLMTVELLAPLIRIRFQSFLFEKDIFCSVKLPVHTKTNENDCRKRSDNGDFQKRYPKRRFLKTKIHRLRVDGKNE